MKMPSQIALQAPVLPIGRAKVWPATQRLLPGLALCAGLAFVGIELGKLDWLQSHGLSALTLAIVLGMLVGNSFYPAIANASGPGVGFSKGTLLRLGVILYGFRLTMQDIGHVGIAGVAIDALVLCSTFAIAWWVGTRVFKLDRNTAMLIGAGSSICGAAAVMAAEPVVKGRAEEVTVAVSTVVVFGTLAIFLYPALYALSLHLRFIPAGTNAFGIYAGSTIHEVAQVVAAARAIGPDAANTAVIAKMVRVMMLAPFLIALSAWRARDAARSHARDHAASSTAGKACESREPRAKLAIPWFAVAFIGVVVLNSFLSLPTRVTAEAIDLDTFLLAMAMAALGLSTHVSAIRKAGIKPLLLGALLFGWLIAGGAAINSAVTTLIG